MKRAILIASAIFVACSALIDAQWPKYQDSGVPRDEKGRVRIDAAPPRTADGKPDLSGNWTRSDRDPLPAELKGIVRDRDLAKQPGSDTPPEGIFVEPGTPSSRPDPKSPPLATFFELGANMPSGLPFTTWAADLKKQRMAANAKDNPDANCLPMGIPQFHMQPQPRKIIQTPKLIVILYEANYGLRYIYMDGRKLPPLGEPQPWWYGYSVGRWEGDALVVESNNFRAPSPVSTTGGWTCAAVPIVIRPNSPSGSAVRPSAGWKSMSRSRTQRRTRSRSPFASISGSSSTKSRLSSSATRISNSGSASKSTRSLIRKKAVFHNPSPALSV